MTKRRGGSKRKGGRPSSRKKSSRSSFQGPSSGGKGSSRKPSSRYKTSERKAPFLKEAAKQTEELLKNYLSQSKKLMDDPYIPPENPCDELDPWQRQAVDALLAESNVVVSAPTTAGKTRVVEAYFYQLLDDPKFRACYTTPVRSLANDKYREFKELFGEDRVGIATGDMKRNLDAPIVVSTLETYRNSLLGIEPDLGRKIVVFDEYHYIQDKMRGSAWEESIILTPPHCRILMLSASLSNPHEFVGWLQKLHGKPSEIILVDKRPVPLEDLINLEGKWVAAKFIPPGFLKSGKRSGNYLRPMDFAVLVKKLRDLPDLNLAPAIVYAGRRLACEDIAREMMRGLKPLSQDESSAMIELLKKVDSTLGSLRYLSNELHTMITKFGVAYHHSGLSTPVRLTIEDLIKGGSLRFCSATMGLSLGINFSVKSVVISDFSRPSEEGFVRYDFSELLQMLGRAGRRGKDAVGFSLWPSVESYAHLGNPRKESISSQLRYDPTTFLGLIGRGMSLVRIEEFYRKSFMAYKEPGVDFSLITTRRLKQRIERIPPCASPVAEYQLFREGALDSGCLDCSSRGRCHQYFDSKGYRNSFAGMHQQLHWVGAIDRTEGLTPMGSLARYFPQSGGMLVARMIDDGRITPDNLLKTTELLAALATPSYKTPDPLQEYKFPWDRKKIEKEVMDLYPLEVYPELYDMSPRNPRPELRDFCPDAGFVLSEWMRGAPWTMLLSQCGRGRQAPGDIMAILYRTASYLQSIGQAGAGEISKAALTLRDELLREPMGYVV